MRKKQYHDKKEIQQENRSTTFASADWTSLLMLAAEHEVSQCDTASRLAS